MKRNLLILSFACALFSCKSKQTPTTKDSTVNTVRTIVSTDKAISLADQFKPVLDGAWVKKDYINEIAKTRSPLKAYYKSEPITTLIIDTSYLKNDTLRVEVGYGNHEGGEMMLKFTPGRMPGSVKFLSSITDDGSKWVYELKYEVSKADTTLTLYTYDEHTNKLKDSTIYIKASKKIAITELGSATYYMVNQALISGTYHFADSVNKKVTFTNDGKVSGLDSFTGYSVNVDFTTPPSNLDDIYFVAGEKENVAYAYAFDKDTLKLFDKYLPKDSVEEVLGKLRYKLVRQHSSTTQPTR